MGTRMILFLFHFSVVSTFSLVRCYYYYEKKIQAIVFKRKLLEQIDHREIESAEIIV